MSLHLHWQVSQGGARAARVSTASLQEAHGHTSHAKEVTRGSQEVTFGTNDATSKTIGTCHANEVTRRYSLKYGKGWR